MSDPTQDQPLPGPLAEVHARLDAFDLALSENTVATHANAAGLKRVEGTVTGIKQDTGDIVAFFQAGKGAFKVLGWLGVIFKWVGYMAAAATALYVAWTTFKTGVGPGPGDLPK